MSRSGARKIYTRDGWVALRSEMDFKTLGSSPHSRREALIDEYADTHPPELRQAVRDSYRRAYMRAGLLPGDPDSIDTVFPAGPDPELPVPSKVAPESADSPSDSGRPPRDSPS